MISTTFGWAQPTGALLTALNLGALLALLIYFRHDFASMISCFLQVILYRKRPMTLDERLPLFLFMTTLPLALISYYFRESTATLHWNPLLSAITFASMGIPLSFFDYLNRKTKGMFDWNWLDAMLIGLIQMAALIPGWDSLSCLLMGALFLNYRREPATKYAYFALTPFLFVHAFSGLRQLSFDGSPPMTDLSWLSFVIAVIVTLLAGLISIGGFTKHMQEKGLGQYIFYRWALAGAFCAYYWMRGLG
jgi:undecaprenyl-diphosphatase